MSSRFPASIPEGASRRIHILSVKFTLEELGELVRKKPKASGPLAIWARRELLRAAESEDESEEGLRLAEWARRTLAGLEPLDRA